VTWAVVAAADAAVVVVVVGAAQNSALFPESKLQTAHLLALLDGMEMDFGKLWDHPPRGRDLLNRLAA